MKQLKKYWVQFNKFNGFCRVITRLVTSIIQNDFYGRAAEMGFMLVLGIFPFMLFLMAIFGWMGNKSYMDPILQFLSNLMPQQAMDLILTVLSEVMIFEHGGEMAVIGLIVTIILSTNSVAVILKGLNTAYNVTETRNFVYTRILAFIMFVIFTLILFLSINLIIFGKIIITFAVNHLNLSHIGSIALMTLRWPIAFLALYLMAFLSYYILPDLKGNEKFKRASALPGSLFFCTFWLIGSWGFSVYVNNLKTYNFVYGIIGAFIVLMVWLYYTSILLLIGGEINSQTYNKLNRKADEIKEDFANLKQL